MQLLVVITGDEYYDVLIQLILPLILCLSFGIVGVVSTKTLFVFLFSIGPYILFVSLFLRVKANSPQCREYSVVLLYNVRLSTFSFVSSQISVN